MNNFYKIYNIFLNYRIEFIQNENVSFFFYTPFFTLLFVDYPSSIWYMVTLTRGFAVRIPVCACSFLCHLTEFMIMSSIFNPCRNYD